MQRGGKIREHATILRHNHSRLKTRPGKYIHVDYLVNWGQQYNDLPFSALAASVEREPEISEETSHMAMTMNGEVQLPASREAVWAKLNDPGVLKACIPGCEELEKTE